MYFLVTFFIKTYFKSFRFTENLQNTDFLSPHPHFPLLTTANIILYQLCICHNWADIDILLLAKVKHFFSDLFSFYLISIFYSSPQFRNHITLNCSIFLGSSWLWQWPWWFWGVLVRFFVQCASRGICLMFFLKLRLWVWGRKTTEGKCHSHHITSRVGTTTTTRHCWYWPGSPGWGSVSQVSPLWSYSSAPLPIMLALEISLYGQPPLKDWVDMLYLLEGGVSTQIIWNSMPVICLFFSTYLFSYFFLPG